MELALVLAFITFIGWGTGDLFTIYSVRKIGTKITIIWIYLFSFLLALVALPFFPHNVAAITFPLLCFNIILGLFFVFGNVLVAEAFRISSAPLIGVIIPSFPAAVLVLNAILYHDTITPLQMLCILVILFGVSLCCVNFTLVKKSKKIFDRGTTLALIAITFFTIFFTFSRILIHTYGWFLPTFIATACFPILFFLFFKGKEKFTVPKNTKILFSLFMVALLIRSGDFAFNYGITLPNASGIVTPIANAAPVLFVVTSFLFYRDKLSKQQVFGILVTLIGLILLTFFGTK
ncbi:MAG TPA: DMT family transporter [Candidatus Saccharimonadales bacterium]|nr:DMT family transporter [Candidatus Saccharimonadales bacterium]